MNEAVGKSVGGDFSDQRLVNQIGGMAGKIANDPIVKNGVAGTAAIQAGLAAVEQSKKDKNYAPQNEQYFQNMVNQWVNDGDLQSTFEGSYTPHVDYIERFTKLYKEAHPGENVDRDSFMLDKNGNLQVDPVLKSGIDANKVASIWNLVSSQPDVQQQLNIDGWSRYRGVSPQTLWESSKKNTNMFLDNAEKAIQDLQTKIATDKTINAAEATAKINAYKEQITQQKNQFNSLSSLLQQNPEAAKAALVNNEVLSSLIGSYSYEEMKKSPLWETNMESLKFDLDVTKNQLEQEKFKYQMGRDVVEDALKVKLALIAHSGKKGDGSDSGDGGFGDVRSDIENVPQETGKLGQYSFNQLVKDKTNEVNQGTYGVVFGMFNSGDSTGFNPIKKNQATGAFEFNVDRTGTTGYRTMEEAHNAYRKAYMDGREAVLSGKAPQNVVGYYQSIDPSLRDLKQLTAAKDELDTQKAAAIESMKGRLGGNYNPDYIDAYQVFNQTPGWEQAKARLDAKYSKNGQPWQVGIGFSLPTIAGAYNAGTVSGPKQGDYDKFSKNFDASLVPQFNAIENAYKERQVAYYPISSTFLAGKPAEKESIRQAFTNVANAAASGEGAIANSAKEFKDLLSDTKGHFEKNIYGARADRQSGKYYLTVQQDTEAQPTLLEVSKAVFDSFPNLRANNDFDNKFGSSFAVSGGITTDAPYKGVREGIGSAFHMDRPIDSKYDVRYHVFQTPAGSYDLKMYIKDAKTGNDIIAGKPAGFNASKAGIMDALEQLKSDVYIEGLIPTDVLLKMKNAGQ